MTEALPRVTFVIDVDDPLAEPALRTTVDSLLALTDPRWELVVHGVAGSEVTLPADPRIRLVTAPSASGLAGLVRGELTAWLEPGGEVAAELLAWLDTTVDEDTDLVYTDEILVAADGEERLVRKPAWSPQRLRGHDWTGHLVLVSTDVLGRVGGLRDEHQSAARHDLMLRVGEVARRVTHLDEVGYRSPVRSDPSPDAAERGWDETVAVVADHLTRVGVSMTAERGPRPTTVSLTRSRVDDLSVTAVIPTAGGRGLAWGRSRRYVVNAVRSLLEHAGHDRLEVLVVHQPDISAWVLDELREVAGDALHLEPHLDHHVPAMVNRGILASSSDAVLILDEHIEVVGPALVRRLVGPLVEPGVGMTGPMIRRTEGAVAGAGLAVYGTRVVPLFAGATEPDPGQPGILDVDREVTAVSGRCAAVLREPLERVGGLCEELPSLYEADLSLKLASLGLASLWVAGTSAVDTRPPGWSAETDEGEHRRWRDRWSRDDHDAFVPSYRRRDLPDRVVR